MLSVIACRIGKLAHALLADSQCSIETGDLAGIG